MIGYLGVDEKSFRKGHKYVTVVNDLARGRVLYVAEDRKQSSLDGFWPTLTKEQREWIAGVALDMWDPYVKSIRAASAPSRREDGFRQVPRSAST